MGDSGSLKLQKTCLNKIHNCTFCNAEHLLSLSFTFLLVSFSVARPDLSVTFTYTHACPNQACGSFLLLW